MDDLDDKLIRADRLERIAKSIGFTLWQLQPLEGVVATYLTLTTKLQKGMGTTESLAVLEKIKKRTFGTNVEKIINSGLLEPNLGRRLREFVLERNWLVHRSRENSRSAVHSDEKMWQLCARLEDITNEADALMEEFTDLAKKFLSDQGISAAKINEKITYLLKKWHNS